jgi:hypothetical protein
MTVPKSGEFWKVCCASADSQPGVVLEKVQRIYGGDGLTDQELEVVHVLAVRAPSCANVAFLLLEGLEEELKWLFPVCSALNWEDEAFCDRHFEL